MSHQTPDWEPLTPPITAAELPDVVATQPFVLLHIWAVWNGYDKKMDAIIQSLRPLYEPRIAFYSVNTDDQDFWPLMRMWGVQALPALVFYRRGEWCRNIGFSLNDPSSLRTKLDEWLAEIP